MKILLVEDEAFMQEAMSSVIERSGIEVLKTDNVKSAIEILSTDQINLVITDLYFPQPDGFELINHIKNNPVTMHIPVIVVTGFESEGGNTLKNLPGDLFLKKPFTLDALRRAIREFSDNEVTH